MVQIAINPLEIVMFVVVFFNVRKILLWSSLVTGVVLDFVFRNFVPVLVGLVCFGRVLVVSVIDVTS